MKSRGFLVVAVGGALESLSALSVFSTSGKPSFSSSSRSSSLKYPSLLRLASKILRFFLHFSFFSANKSHQTPLWSNASMHSVGITGA